MQAEQASLEAKNHELVNAFKEKSKSQQHIQRLYQSLKAQVMASHVATAAGDEAELTLQSARGEHFIERLPGTRTGTANYRQTGMNQGSGRPHNRADSRSSGSSGQQRGGVGIGPMYASHLQGRGLGRTGTGRKFAIPHLRVLFIVLLTLSRLHSHRYPVSSPPQPPSGSRRHTSKRFPEPRPRPYIPNFTDDTTASWSPCGTWSGLCATKCSEGFEEGWRNKQYRTVGTIGRMMSWRCRRSRRNFAWCRTLNGVFREDLTYGVSHVAHVVQCFTR
jgi:hypothetical protein